MVQPRIFAGAALRTLRRARALRQQELAAQLGISASYLSQLEHDDRPLTPLLIDRLRTRFPVEWQDAPLDQSAQLLQAFDEALGGDPSTAQLRKIAEQFPDFAQRFIDLARTNRANLQRLEMLDEALGADRIAGGRLPWEEVRDWFHNSNNYVDTLDRAAEAFAQSLPGDTSIATRLSRWLADHDTALVLTQSGPIRHFDRAGRTLTINTAKAPGSLAFHLAWHIASTAFRREIAAVAGDTPLRSTTTRRLLEVGLGNYMAGAILMPYEAFRQAARETRHDVDRLRHIFGTSFEQVCHRLSTLQRPGARGVPMFFCRVDMAGNITKRHSATRLRFARFGGACPLWVVHEAVAVPDQIHVQLAEMPDGTRYVSIAKGLVKQTGSYRQRPRRYAVALGCEADFAGDFIYADDLNLAPRAATPIGESCRICPRGDCDQRAFPPNDREITVDIASRDTVPYRIEEAP